MRQTAQPGQEGGNGARSKKPKFPFMLLLLLPLFLDACAFRDRLELEKHPVAAADTVDRDYLELRRCIARSVAVMKDDKDVRRYDYVSSRFQYVDFYVLADDTLAESLALIRRGPATTEIHAYALDDRREDMQRYIDFLRQCAAER
jgi:hypothetical protein